MDGDGNVIKMRKLGYYSFVHSEELYNAYDTYKVISNLSSAGFKDDNFVIIQGDNNSASPTKKRGFKSRSAVVESCVNNQIDNAMNLMR